MDDIKVCVKCGKGFPRTKEFFYANVRQKDGLLPRCKTCFHTYRQPRPTVPEGHKYCPHCKQSYPATLDYFSKNRSRYDQLHIYCKQCDHDIQMAKYDRARNQPLRESPPDFLVCKQCGQAKPATDEYFQKQPTSRYGLWKTCKECSHARGKRNRQANRAKRYQWELEYNNTHREQLATSHKQWYQSGGKEIVKMHTHGRRARQRQVPGSYTSEQIRELHKRQKSRCYYCSGPLGDDYHVDHTFPLSREGASNDISHLVLTCPTCNLKKGNKYPWEFFEGGRLL